MKYLVYASTIIILGLVLKFGGLAFTGNVALETESTKLSLTDFPEIFTVNGILNALVVHRGDDIAVSNVFDVLNARTLECNSRIGKKVEDVVVGDALVDKFGTEIENNDLKGMFDSNIRISINGVDNSYKAHDEIRLSNDDSLGVHTGLSYDQSSDWKNDVFIPLETGVLSYYFVFDELLRTGNFITSASEQDPITIEFLGKELEIQRATANSVSVNVGKRFYIKAGECINVNSKKVCLVQTSTGGATITVDNMYGVIADGDDEIINGLEIRVEDVSFEEGIEFDAAALYLGEEARETFNDGEAYIGEDEDDPRWIWVLQNLDTNTPIIGIQWDRSATNPDDEDVIYEGEEVCLPHDYSCLKLVEVKINDWSDYSLEDGTESLYATVNDVNPEFASASVLVFNAKDGEYFDASGTKTDKIYIYSTGAGLRLYREESGKAVFFATEGNGVFSVNYKDTSLSVDLQWNAANDNGLIVLNMPVGDDISIYIEADPNDATKFNYLGHSQGDTDTADDILYGTEDISGYDDDVLTPSCVIVLDPESHQSGDDIELGICEDSSDYKADVAFIKMPSGSCFSGTNLVESVHFVENENMIIVGDFGLPFLTPEMAEKYSNSKGLIGLVQKGNMKALLVLAHNPNDLIELTKRLSNEINEDIIVV